MRTRDNRKFDRIPVTMTLDSKALPSISAKLTDLSDGGARIVANGTSGLGENGAMVPVTVRLPCNTQALFEGNAKVVWSKRSSHGVEAGLQWTDATANAWADAKQLIFS